MSQPTKHLPWLVLLFAGSGAAALIYEVVWFHLLQLVVGSSSTSLGVLLGTFMGGMCLGSLALGLADPKGHPLRVYAVLEVFIGVSALALLAALPLVDDFYLRFGGGRISVRIVIAAICLLPPTFAMGATLPAMARSVRATPSGVSWIGLFYAGNLGGAVFGCLLAGFYLLRRYDVNVATVTAVALNLAVAAGALVIARRQGTAVPERSEAPPAPVRNGSFSIHLVIALSGLTALSAQVLWTRLLSLGFGATVYTFSLILAAFLLGLGAGSASGTWLGRRSSVGPRVSLGWCQILLAVAIGWAAYLLAEAMPYWSTPQAVSQEPWRLFGQDISRALLVVMPGAALWGASFPLALACVAGSSRDPARLVGGIYAANTVGAIVGALGTSALLALSVGSQRLQQLLIVLTALSGVIALLSSKRRDRGASEGWVQRAEWVGIAVAVAVLAAGVSPVPAALIAYGRRSAEYLATARVADAGRIIYSGEGVNDYVAVSRGPNGQLYYHAAGKVQASTVPEDMRLQLMLAHLSHLVPERPSNVLVIGCGAGITAGALATAPGVDRITIAEIEPLVPRVASEYFGDYNNHLLDDPRVSIRIDDGRHFLATTADTFDVITTDLIDPWVKGVASLFTREFFELARQRLRPGGVVTQFVQLYQSSPEAVKSEIATFVEVFPNAMIWGNPHAGEGYDLVLLGQVEPLTIDVDRLNARLSSAPYAKVVESLRAIGISSGLDLLSTYVGSGPGLRPWLADAAINRDRNLRLQYLAGIGLNQEAAAPIYRDILRYSNYPEQVFAGSPSTLDALRQVLRARAILTPPQ